MREQLGKIQSVHVGFGGYQGAMFGVNFDLGGKGWGVSDFDGCWAHWDTYCKWKPEDRDKRFAEVMNRLAKLCEQANVSDVYSLVNKPVSITFDDDERLKSWRLLSEVL